MKHSKLFSSVALLFLLAMIFDSKTAFSGAAEGVQLCISTVIPSLFPFFVISIILTSGLSGHHFLLFSPIGRLLGIPNGSESILLMGLLGGYPVGAQCIAQACQDRRLSRQDGERMLAFCSNAGPAFLFGIGSSLFPKIWICWLLWGIHIVSALIIGLIVPKNETASFPSVPAQCVGLTFALQQAVRSMAMICGWIILFRTLISFCSRWLLWLLPGSFHLLMTGLLELANGCCALQDVSDIGLRMLLFSFFLGFGGLCVLLQTRTVLNGSGLRGQAYFPGKVMHGTLSFLLCLLAQLFLPGDMRHIPNSFSLIAACFLCLCCGIYLSKMQKGSSFPAAVGV